MRKLSRIFGIGFSTLLMLSSVACVVEPGLMPDSTEKPNPTRTILPTIIPPVVETASQPAVSSTLTATVTLNFTNPRTEILAKNLANPDDLVSAPIGSLYISDISAGTVKKLFQDGSIQTVVSGLSVPEGMVYLPRGLLIIAEQGKNRLLEYDLNSGNLVTFLNLSNTTSQEGIDGIALDAHSAGGESIIIPDSPNGVLRRTGLDGNTSVVIASGFSRPTGAWVEGDGSILVVDENTGYLTRVHPDGKKDRLARFSIPDDVIEDSEGNIYVNSLGDHAVHVLTAQGEDIVLMGNISDPQGIAFTADGNLAVTDPVNHALIKIIIRNH